MTSDMEIAECRDKLRKAVAYAAIGELHAGPLRDAVNALVQFERLDAVAQLPCRWCNDLPCSGDDHTVCCASLPTPGSIRYLCEPCEAVPALAEIVTAVLGE